MLCQSAIIGVFIDRIFWLVQTWYKLLIAFSFIFLLLFQFTIILVTHIVNAHQWNSIDMHSIWSKSFFEIILFKRKPFHCLSKTIVLLHCHSAVLLFRPSLKHPLSCFSLSFSLAFQDQLSSFQKKRAFLHLFFS